MSESFDVYKFRVRVTVVFILATICIWQHQWDDNFGSDLSKKYRTQLKSFNELAKLLVLEKKNVHETENDINFTHVASGNVLIEI